jgi:hypothetical protein
MQIFISGVGEKDDNAMALSRTEPEKFRNPSFESN